MSAPTTSTALAMAALVPGALQPRTIEMVRIAIVLDAEGLDPSWWSTRVELEAECIFWRGAKKQGYGQIYHGKWSVSAHRVAYEEAVGPIPSGLVVLHACDNPPCVRPSHLSVGTVADNVHDCIAKGRHRNNRRRLYCPQGHLVAGDNAYWYRGYAQCVICRREHIKSYRRRHAA